MLKELRQEDNALGILVDTDHYTNPSFSLKNRLARLLWGTVYTLFFRTSPRTFHIWRSFLLRCFGAKIGKRCRIGRTAKIWAPWNLVMEDYAALADDANCYCMASVWLGKKALVSQGTYLCTGTHDYENPKFQLYAKPIYIEANTWICAECFVHPGVTISEGAVIGARSVVTKNMPQWTVCAGNPCKPIKPRLMRVVST